MSFFAVSDIHGRFKELNSVLEENNFKDSDKLIILGDILDRGSECKALTAFIVSLIEQDRVVLIRGNHEDLLDAFLDDIEYYCESLKDINSSPWFRNGTFKTISQLTGMSFAEIIFHPKRAKKLMLETQYYRVIRTEMRDYFETQEYILVHGWIPAEKTILPSGAYEYTYLKDWRSADKEAWEVARWFNGIDAARSGAFDTDKTIICGHVSAAYGHSSEGRESDYSIYRSKGIIAINSSMNQKINCLIIDD